MKYLRDFAERMTTKLGIEPDIAVGKSKVTMLGANELQIENHNGIVEYSPETVRINTEKGVLLVEGTNLFLNVFDKDRIVVSGIIHHFRALDGGKR